MDPEQKREEIFAAAIEFENRSERDAYIAQACGKDQELLEKVQSLLGYHDGNSFLDVPVLEVVTGTEISPLIPSLGAVIDRYRLLEKIGEGGMAVVYMAEQLEPIHRKVALKIIKLGMDTKSVIARFEAERQALAMMDHPNIAKVFDAGATETGRPYFVMELVTGVSIAEYCDKNKLSINERLKLFTSVCLAVQHAHQKGIIHRDIKPSNVMVTLHDGQPIPKVIDFGIAKAINQRLTEKTLFTRYVHMVGTPAYMSPEQADMSDLGVDTRTDIYSLGVLLYELLTGMTPFDAEELHKVSLSKMQKIICEREPTKPSTKLNTVKESLTEIAGCRRTNLKILSGTMRGELDWIVMKCLEKDRTRRYETVHALAEDVERHLNNEPILAGSPSLIYRAEKFWKRHQSQITAAAVITVLVASLFITAWMYLRSVNARKVQWAKGEALPRIIKLIEQHDYRQAFSLATRAKESIPEDPALKELWPRICKDYSITTTPVGANVSYREYSAVDAPWEYLGQTPLKNITLPQGLYRWKIEKEGFATHECVVDNSFDVRLQEKGINDAVVWVKGWEMDKNTTIEIPAFLIDKYEVTNEQYKEFMDQGGYENHGYWSESQFLKEGRRISWNQAVGEFVDETGQPGPASWESGTYPEGQGKYPVCGISWFEADAYARFAGKSLPTVYHWERAACLEESFVIVPYSNFNMSRTAPVGSHMGMGHTGLYDMAGNVKEWCLNATDDSGNLRYILGGGWGEPTYLFTDRDFRSPWNRSPLNGFRCIRYPEKENPVDRALFDPIEQLPARDISKLVPFTDEEFASLLEQYRYDRLPLNAQVQDSNDSTPFWTKQKITFDAAYGGERMIAYLFLPKTGKQPYQTVIYFPGMDAISEESFVGLPYSYLTEFIIKSGRALLFPVYKGTYNRPAARGRVWTISSVVQTPLAYRDWTIQTAKDLGRSIDYLETRDDIDHEKVAYLGLSWGAMLGPIMLAVEDRINTGIFVSGGLAPIDFPRSFDIALYAQRVKAPILMVNGREDVFLPVRTSQIPMFELLGTPDEHKKRELYDGGHGLFGLFYRQIQDDVLAWLNRYLGEVQ